MLKELVTKLLLDKPQKASFKLYRGVPVSKVQLELAERLRIPRQHINYKIGYYYADIAFPKDKVLIEYNGWFWHKNSSYKDAARTGYLLQKGWSLIIIKGSTKLPTMAVMKQAIQRAKKGNRYQEIVLEDWGKK